VPIGFVCLVFTLVWQLAVGAAPRLELASGVVLTVAALALTVAFLRRVFRNVAEVRGDAIDLSNW
jgi:hypothetical protein